MAMGKQDKEKGFRDPKLTAYFAACAQRMYDESHASGACESWDDIATKLNVKKPYVINAIAAKQGADMKGRRGLAALFHNNSLDETEAAANQYWEEHPEVHAKYESPDTSADADEAVAQFAITTLKRPKEAIERARAKLRKINKGGSVDAEQFLELINAEAKLLKLEEEVKAGKVSGTVSKYPTKFKKTR